MNRKQSKEIFNKTISSKLKYIRLNCCRTSTAYGVPNLVNSKTTFNKNFWLFYLCVSLVLSAWFIVNSVKNYLSYDVVTKIERLYEQPLQFPTVSFCPVSGDKAFKNDSLFKKRLKDCSFSSDTDCLKNPERYFESFIHETNGQCYRFNSGKNLNNQLIQFYNSTIGGKYDSFRLKIEYHYGLIIWIHDHSLPPRTQICNNHDGTQLYASPKFETHFIIDKIVDKSLEKPYNPCYKDFSNFELNRTIIDYFKNANEAYRQSNCLELCFDLDCLENSECICNSTLGNVWRECYKNNDSPILKNKLDFYKNKLVEKCSKYCPLECDSVSYSVSLNTFTNDNKAINEAEIYVYYRNLKYTLITQQPKMIVYDLISNIGGIFGFFISLSFVTFFEICDFLFKISLFNIVDQ